MCLSVLAVCMQRFCVQVSYQWRTEEGSWFPVIGVMAVGYCADIRMPHTSLLICRIGPQVVAVGGGELRSVL